MQLPLSLMGNFMAITQNLKGIFGKNTKLAESNSISNMYSKILSNRQFIIILKEYIEKLH